MTYEKYNCSDYWDFIPKDQQQEFKAQGNFPESFERKNKNQEISETSSPGSIEQVSILGKRTSSPNEKRLEQKTPLKRRGSQVDFKFPKAGADREINKILAGGQDI